MLTLIPCLAVWVWVAMPFPVNDPYKDSPLPDWPDWPRKPKGNGTTGGDDDGDREELPIDVNFYFFLTWLVQSMRRSR